MAHTSASAQGSRLVKADLHVHSHFSDSPKIYLLAKGNARECYTTPEQVYTRAMARGMDLVTITDHDTIRGALEIAHHGDHVFLSEEVSVRFPDNGCIVHVLTFDITEAQHDEMQRLRYNIYDFVQYVRQENICHVLAHPLSSVNQRLRKEHIEQCLLMFRNIELLNGPRDPYHQKALEQIFEAIDRPTLERWANTYNIEPVTLDLSWGFTGGSDDHSGLAIARAYTTFEGAPTVADLKQAIDERRTEVAGEYMTPISAAHNIYSGVVQYFRETKSEHDRDGIYDQLFRTITTQGAALQEMGDMTQLLNSPLGRLVMAFQQAQFKHKIPTWERMVAEGATEEFQLELHAFGQDVMRNAWRGVTSDLIEAVDHMHLDRIINLTPAILQFILLHTPYYIAFRYFFQDRRRAEALHEALDLGYTPKETQRVAIFVDTLDDINGVTLGLRRMIRELRQRGRQVHLIGLRTDTVERSVEELEQLAGDLDVESIMRFEALGQFPLPGYDHANLGIPPTLEMMQWCVEHEIDLVQVSTPGPVGLAGLAIARMLGTPIVGHYHTQVPEYAQRLIGDKNITAIVRGYVAWFYGALDQTIVPSRATRDNLRAMGISRDKLRLLSRGVDTQRFTPARRSGTAWERYGLNGKTKLLYVGRISKEKNLDDLVSCYRTLREEGLRVELGIVGDGPYKDALRTRINGTPGVTFTGYVGGDELAELFASADLFVFPSTTDTFGNVVLEAQASSLPVVVTDQGGPSELIVHNHTGMIVPAANPTALTDAVRGLVQDNDRRARMARAARDHVADMSHANAAEQLWDFYNERIHAHRDAQLRELEEGF